MLRQLLLLVVLGTAVQCLPTSKFIPWPFRYVSRDEWGARPHTGVSYLDLPAPFVIIHHTYIPGACHNAAQCMAAMRSMQNSHQGQGWTDIGYNFAVGSDGAVYEGRGWRVVGAHARGYNTQSIGIVLIGDWRTSLPPRRQLQTAQNLIALGVRLGFISRQYSLIGHRQVVATECPGDALYKEIMTWDRFTTQV